MMDFSDVGRLALALFLGGVIGFERRWHGHAAGPHTNALVAFGTALFVLLGRELGPDSIGRIIALQNQVELRNIQGAYGMQFDAVNNDTNNPVGYTNLVVRGNRIRPIDGATAAVFCGLLLLDPVAAPIAPSAKNDT